VLHGSSLLVLHGGGRAGHGHPHGHGLRGCHALGEAIHWPLGLGVAAAVNKLQWIVSIRGLRQAAEM
jgi:hypothetical protein